MRNAPAMRESFIKSWDDDFLTNIDKAEATLYLMAAKNTGFSMYIKQDAHGKSGKPIAKDVALHSRDLALGSRDHHEFWLEAERLKAEREKNAQSG